MFNSAHPNLPKPFHISRTSSIYSIIIIILIRISRKKQMKKYTDLISLFFVNTSNYIYKKYHSLYQSDPNYTNWGIF